MATIHDLEQTIVFLASNYASAICQLDGTEERAHELSQRLIGVEEERDTLLTENSALRSTVDAFNTADEYDSKRDRPAGDEARGVWLAILDKPHQALPEIQGLIDERDQLRTDLETVRKLSELYQAQSLEFCRNYEREEARANGLQTNLDKAIAKLHAVRFGKPRAEVKRMKKGKGR